MLFRVRYSQICIFAIIKAYSTLVQNAREILTRYNIAFEPGLNRGKNTCSTGHHPDKRSPLINAERTLALSAVMVFGFNSGKTLDCRPRDFEFNPPSYQLKLLKGDMYWFVKDKMLPCISTIHWAH